jgi:hypothetical protein
MPRHIMLRLGTPSRQLRRLAVSGKPALRFAQQGRMTVDWRGVGDVVLARRRRDRFGVRR